MSVLVERQKTNRWKQGHNRPVLVLNQGWQWHQIETVEECFGKLCPDVGEAPKARILDAPDGFAQYSWDDWKKLRPKEDAEWVLYGVNVVHRVPEIILLTEYDKQVRNGVRFNRRELRLRDGGKCQYCGKKCDPDEWTIDHVVPRCQGGQSTWTNCVLACYRCNQRKNDKTPQQAGMKLLSVPVKPKVALSKIDIRRAPESWQLVMPKDMDRLISQAYWEVPLQ